jgi:hypothetical protein
MGIFRSAAAVFCVWVVAVGIASSVKASPIVVPAGLSPGDRYRLAFVAPTYTNLPSADIGYYNDYVNNLGFAATGISGWKAIASTVAVDARDNTGTNHTIETGSPIYLLDGTTKIADNNADLWDRTIQNDISLTETLSTHTWFAGSRAVWTGTFWQHGIEHPGGGLKTQNTGEP